MNALQKAKKEIRRCEASWAENDMNYASISVVTAYAAIAQAEQLQRIADLLERGLAGETQSPIETWAVVDGLRQRLD